MARDPTLCAIFDSIYFFVSCLVLSSGCLVFVRENKFFLMVY